MKFLMFIIPAIFLYGAYFEVNAADAQPLKAGTMAPTFSLPTLDGNREALRVWCGTNLSKPYINDQPYTVILSFWATYCKPCKKEIPELIKFYEKNSKKKIKIFLINMDKEGASVANPYVEENKVTLPVLLDPYHRTAERYKVKSLPALFVIAPDGTVKYSSVGYHENVSMDSLLTEVTSAIEEKREVVDIKEMNSPGESVGVAEALGDKADEQFVPEGEEDETDGGEVNDKSGDETASENAAIEADNNPNDEKPYIKPRKRWLAVARVECGNPVEDIARELGVETEDIRTWYKDLKTAALEIWKNEDRVVKEN